MQAQLQNQSIAKSHAAKPRARGWLSSTIGRKQLIGVTGLGLSGFVLTHMLGNMLILVGPQAYNEYSHKLITNPFLIVAELGLLLMFVVHLVMAVRLSWSNWQARDTRYKVASNGPKGTSFIQKSLWAQGLLILVFVILHLITFKYGTVYTVNYGAGEMRDLHRLVIETFREPLYTGWYVVAVFVLGLHLSHGFGSTFQTLGLHHVRYQSALRCLSILYAVIVAAGFISQPLYVLLTN